MTFSDAYDANALNGMIGLIRNSGSYTIAIHVIETMGYFVPTNFEAVTEVSCGIQRLGLGFI